MSVGTSPADNSSVIGTFTAAGASQEIMIISGTDNGVDPGLSAFHPYGCGGRLHLGFECRSDRGWRYCPVSGRRPGIPALVDLDASGLSAGAAGAWTNARAPLEVSSQPFGDPTVEVIDGATGVTLDGDGDYFEGPASTPEIEGSSPRSIIAWVYNPELASEETVDFLGQTRWTQTGRTCRSTTVGTTNFGAVGHWGGGGPDIGWHPTNSDVEMMMMPTCSGRRPWRVRGRTFPTRRPAPFTKVFTNGQLSNSEDAALDTFGGLGILVGAQRESVMAWP